MRFLGFLLVFILVVPLIRMVMGLIGQAFANFALRPTTPQQRGPSNPPRAPGGALRQDPVCGTYVSEAVAVTVRDGGQTHYFCSEECREKFRRQGARAAG